MPGELSELPELPELRPLRLEYRRLTEEMLPSCLSLAEEWLCYRWDHEEELPSLVAEFAALRELFANYSALGMTGGAILIAGKLQAFEIGERLNPETLVIHLEKASSDFHGLYQAISQVFCEQEAARFRYINREQDLGLPGLRRAKESYYPHHMVKKYVVTPKG